MKIEWNFKTAYIILGALSFITFFFFNEDKVLVPTWATSFLLLCLITIAAGESWIAWSRSGNLILTTLGKGKGSSDGINPTCDIANATQLNKPSFTCIATGGFVYAGFEARGSKKFLVVPPEHLEQRGGNFFVKTQLRKVKYNQLPSYIQESLNRLPLFKPNKVVEKDNIYFGMTSPFYGTDSAENLKMEETLLANMSMQNEYKHLYEELLEKKGKSEREKDRYFRLLPAEEDE